ncbi:ATP-grasp domain-containing protein [Xylanibacillus composti]|uniref:ATP-grasp domain-containing protein n=1 Tax=Xylanibacillus composti TaxID=1572762 RepID=UPI001FD0D477|nr:ATP-grasp domain-containing protein [Xylanibacillus composti]
MISVGAGKNQLPFIHALEQKGYKVISFDRDQDAPGKDRSVFFQSISTHNIEAAIPWLESLGLDFFTIGCFSCGKALLTQYGIAKRFALPGSLDAMKVLMSSDKRMMRRMLEGKGLSTLEEIEVADMADDHVLDRYLLKSPNGIASNGVRRLTSEDHPAALKKQCPDWFLQEYIDGVEYRVCVIVQGSEVKYCSILERTNLHNSFIIGRLTPVFSDQELEQFVLTAVSRLEVQSAVLKLDIVKQGSRIEIIELDFGIPGDYFETHIAPYCLQYHFIDAYIDLITMKPIMKQAPRPGLYNVVDFIYSNDALNYPVNHSRIEKLVRTFDADCLWIETQAEHTVLGPPRHNQDCLFGLIHNRADYSHDEVNAWFNMQLNC